MTSRPRFPLMALGMLALLSGLWSGLLRLGWGLPLLQPTLPLAHGPLMVSGFLGTLISLERAVALSRLWPYASPLFTGLGALALMVGLPGWGGPLFITVGSLWLLAAFVVIIRQMPALSTITMGLGVLAWLVGNGLWLAGWPLFQVITWWMAFLVLTIAGERLELSRLLSLSRGSRVAFLGAIGLFVGGLAFPEIGVDLGPRLIGVGMVALALWLLRYDMARRTLTKAGLPRFTAISLLSGYGWLLVGGMIGFFSGGLVVGPRYDAFLHAFFLGFVFAMIFGHAPIIFPAVVGVPIPFRPAFYAPLALLHLSLLLRVGGDLALWGPGRQWGGLMNTVAILLFLGNMVRSAWKEAVRLKV